MIYTTCNRKIAIKVARARGADDAGVSRGKKQIGLHPLRVRAEGKQGDPGTQPASCIRELEELQQRFGGRIRRLRPGYDKPRRATSTKQNPTPASTPTTAPTAALAAGAGGSSRQEAVERA